MRIQRIRLDEKTVKPDPVEQFSLLYRTAEKYVRKPEIMCLSTVDGNGDPDSRYVLLKGFSHDGFVFFTDLRSSKARQLTVNPAVALAFYWEPIGIQVRVRGNAKQLDDNDVTAYFITRPRGSRLGAWASKQSAILKGRKPLEQRFRDLAARFLGRAIPKPPYWGGYKVAPEMFEFWKDRRSRLHDRFLYTKSDTGWEIKRLSP